MPRDRKANRRRSSACEGQQNCCCHGSGCQLAESESRSSRYDTVDPEKKPVHVKSDQIESVRLTMSAEPVCLEEDLQEERPRKKNKKKKVKRRTVQRSTIMNTRASEERDFTPVESSRYEDVQRVKTEDLQVVSLAKSEKSKKKKKKAKKSKKQENSESDDQQKFRSDRKIQKSESESSHSCNDSENRRKREVHSLWSLLTGPERKYINEVPRRMPSSSSVYEMVANVDELLFSERDPDTSSKSHDHLDKEASDLIGDRIGQFYLGALKKEDAEKMCRRRMKFRFYHRMPGKDFIFDYNLMPARLMLWMVYRTRKGEHRHFAVQKHHGKWTVVNEANKKFTYFNNLIRYYTGHPGDLEDEK